MSLEYTITYQAENVYDHQVNEAFWQFLILPEENNTQHLTNWSFANSLGNQGYLSTNGLGFRALKLRTHQPFSKITFDFKCTLIKVSVNPFDFLPNTDVAEDYTAISELNFKIEKEPYLRKTALTNLPKKYISIFEFDKKVSIFENLKTLNNWTYIHLYFKTGVTDVNTTLGEIIDKRHGVCQDFSHLFCAIARANGVPARYVSGYIHQGNDYFGDSQMHAWVEAFVPNLGWVGFDPTNSILAAENHVKVSHGKDYTDCAPLKGMVYTFGNNQTQYTVSVQSTQAQQ